MTDEERYAAALEAAKGYFIAAGYTWTKHPVNLPLLRRCEDEL